MEVAQLHIRVKPVAQSRLDQIDMNHIPFGRVFSDHMLTARYREGKWQEVQIEPYGPLAFTPSISALNYGQAVFEGMKAHRGPGGETLLFRPADNFRRINQSAARLSMPAVTEDIFMEGLQELIRRDIGWVPTAEQGALYIRPVMFATDEYIGVKASDSYIFCIFTCPVGPYYAEPVSLLATKDYVRAAIGGTGSAKAAGNYAAALLPDRIAKSQGYNNVLWLDGRDQQYVEECGTMNVFFVIGDTVITPRLTGTILPGITRNSVIQLLRDHGYRIETRPISIYEVQEAYHEGRLKDAFGTGTAATITHIARIGFAGEDITLPPVDDRPVSNWLKDQLYQIRTGQVEDPYGWVVQV